MPFFCEKSNIHCAKSTLSGEIVLSPLYSTTKVHIEKHTIALENRYLHFIILVNIVILMTRRIIFTNRISYIRCRMSNYIPLYFSM